MKQPSDSNCRVCYKAEEHTKHIVAGSTKLAPSDYTNRHNKAAGYSHWMICKHLGLQFIDKYYEHTREGHKCQQYHCYVGHTGYHRSNNTSKLTRYRTV